MNQRPSESPPLSEAVTRRIRVEVWSQPSLEHSKPSRKEWVFEYTVCITNVGLEEVQLLSRHWIITDALEQVQEVRGPGVIGQQPVLAPGDAFQYSSWCVLPTSTGMMKGTYQMTGAGADSFDVEIAPFPLRARYTVH